MPPHASRGPSATERSSTAHVPTLFSHAVSNESYSFYVACLVYARPPFGCSKTGHNPETLQQCVIEGALALLKLYHKKVEQCEQNVGIMSKVIRNPSKKLHDETGTEVHTLREDCVLSECVYFCACFIMKAVLLATVRQIERRRYFAVVQQSPLSRKRASKHCTILNFFLHPGKRWPQTSKS